MEENINLKILKKVLSADKLIDNKTISSINELQEFKKSLASSLKYMDDSNDD